jgi:hypothetical protein
MEKHIPSTKFRIILGKTPKKSQLVVMLQEKIVFTEYFRVYCFGGKSIRVMQYEPINTPRLRYVMDGPPVDKKLLASVKQYTLSLCQGLEYDFNTVEFAVRDDLPYAIDFGNPAPNARLTSVGTENFKWVVEKSTKMASADAKKQKPRKMNMTWENFYEKCCNS